MEVTEILEVDESAEIIRVLSAMDPFDQSATVLFTENINISAKRVTVHPSQPP